MEQTKRRKKSFLRSFKHALFELLHNTYHSFPEYDIIRWLIVLVETIQLTFYPLRRTFKPYWKPASIFDISTYVIYLINPALIVNEIWAPYLQLCYGLVIGSAAVVFLIFLGLVWGLLRKSCTPYLVLMKITITVYATVFFIPCFSSVHGLITIALYGNVLRCIPTKGRLSWKVFPAMTCFEGEHVTVTILGVVGAVCQILIGWLHGIAYWESHMSSSSMFAKHTCVDSLCRIAVYTSISIIVLLIDNSLNLLFATCFILLIFINIYCFETSMPYYNKLTTKVNLRPSDKQILTAVNYFPLASGIILLFAMVTDGKLALDAFFTLFAALPLCGLLAFANVSQSLDISAHALKNFDKPSETLFSIVVLQRWSLFEKTGNRADKFSLAGFVLHHLKICRDMNCPLTLAVTACNAYDIFEQGKTGINQLIKVVRYYITELYCRVIRRYPDNSYARMLFLNYLYEVQGRSWQALAEMRKTKHSLLSHYDQYFMFKIEKAIKHEMKAENVDGNMLQTRITQLTHSFQQKVKTCADGYLQLWTELIGRSKDIDAVQRTFDVLYEARRKLKTHWKQFQGFYAKLTAMVYLYAKFAYRVEGDKRKAGKVLQITHENNHEESEYGDEQSFQAGGAGVLRVSAELADRQRILGCNGAFCRLLGFDKDKILGGSRINSIIPRYLHKEHDKIINAAIADSGFLTSQRNLSVLAVHASGYLVPLRATVQRLLSFTEVSQFCVRFEELPYRRQCLYMLVGIEGNVEAASSEITSWFGIDFRALDKAKVQLSELVPALDMKTLAETVGVQRIVTARLHSAKEGLFPATTSLREKSLVPALESLRSADLKEYKLELTVEPIKFRDVLTAYSARLRFQTDERGERNNTMLQPRLPPGFSYDPQLHCYVRSAREEAQITKSEMLHSAFHKSVVVSSLTRVPGLRQLAQEDSKDKTSIFVNKIMQKLQTEDYGPFQKLAMLRIREAVLKEAAQENEEAYLQMKGCLKTVLAAMQDLLQVLQKANYALAVTKIKQAIVLPNGKPDELKSMELGCISCVEEDSGTINRVNKSRQIEKEFKEKRIQSVLLSNKETRKTLEEHSGLGELLWLSLIVLLIYVVVPLSLSLQAYSSAKVSVDSGWSICNFLANIYRLKGYILEAYNTMILLTYVNQYLSLQDFPTCPVSLATYSLLLAKRMNRTEEVLNQVSDSLCANERKMLYQQKFSFLRGVNEYKLDYSVYGVNATLAAVNPTNVELRELFISFISRINIMGSTKLLPTNKDYIFAMQNIDAFSRDLNSETVTITSMISSEIDTMTKQTSYLLCIAGSIVLLCAAALITTDYWSRKRTSDILTLFFSFSPHDLQPQFHNVQSFLLEMSNTGHESKTLREKDEDGEKHVPANNPTVTDQGNTPQVSNTLLARTAKLPKKRFISSSPLLKVVFRQVTLCLLFLVLLLLMYNQAVVWAGHFKNLYAGYGSISRLLNKFERAVLFTLYSSLASEYSVMYDQKSASYARATIDAQDLVKQFVQYTKENYLLEKSEFNATAQAIYDAITAGNLCAYSQTINSTGANYITLPLATCNALTQGWGKEGLFAYLVYGVQQMKEKAIAFLASGANINFLNQSATDTASGANFLEYYYQSAHLVRPNVEYLTRLVENVISSRCDAWSVTNLWLLWGFAIYLIVFTATILLYAFHRRVRAGHYKMFYTIIPKNLREKSAELRQHVKQLIKLADQRILDAALL